MNLGRLRIGDWLAGLWGAVLIASTFMNWYSVGGTGIDAWLTFTVFDIALALTGLLGLAMVVITARSTSPAPPIAAGVTTCAVALIMLLLVLLRHINEPGPNDLVDVDAGAYVALLATFGLLAGALLAIRDERMPGVPPSPPPEPMPAPPATAA